MNEKEIRATAPENKPVRLGDLPIIKTNILENSREYDKGVIGGYNGTFPLTAATKGNIYLLPATNKFYMCITNYNGTNLTAPNAKFEELSVWANRDKLENLYKFEVKNGYALSEYIDSISSITSYIGNIAIIVINFTTKTQDSVQVKFPITFKRVPFVTVTDNDISFKHFDIGIGWPYNDSVEVKGIVSTATMLVIGEI